MSRIAILSPAFTRIFDFFRFNDNYPKPKKEVYIIGGGWAGINFVNKLDKNKYYPTIIDKNDYFLDTPKMAKSLFTDETPIKKYSEIKNYNDFDFVKNQIKVNTTKEIKLTNGIFDNILVLAYGSSYNDFGIEGVDKLFKFYTLEDFQKLKKRIDSGNPNQRVVIAGAGPVGIELAFQMKNKFEDIVILEASNTILIGFSDKMKEKVLNELEKENIKIRLNSKITKVNDFDIEIDNANIYYDIGIWTAGKKKNINLEIDDKLRVFNEKNIYVIGDLVNNGPPTAQNAKQMGEYLAEVFNSNFTKEEPYEYKEKGKIIHCRDKIFIEINNNIYTVPDWKVVNNIIEFFRNY